MEGQPLRYEQQLAADCQHCDPAYAPHQPGSILIDAAGI